MPDGNIKMAGESCEPTEHQKSARSRSRSMDMRPNETQGSDQRPAPIASHQNGPPGHRVGEELACSGPFSHVTQEVRIIKTTTVSFWSTS